jgi:hypothetical protein
MPTGYTNSIYSGKKEVTLADYISDCARAFGAFVHMRDTPMDAPLTRRPKDWGDSNYYSEHLEEQKKELEKIFGMTSTEQLQYGQSKINKHLTESQKQLNVSIATTKRYTDMLEKVSNWHVADELRELKKFAIEQLEQSIKFDDMTQYYTDTIKKYATMTPEMYVQEQITYCENQIRYYEKCIREQEAKKTDFDADRYYDLLEQSLGIKIP